MSINYNRIRELVEHSTDDRWTVDIHKEWDEVIVANEAGHLMSLDDAPQVRFEMVSGNRNYDPYLVAFAPEMARDLIRLGEGVETIRDHCASLARSARAAGMHTLSYEMNIIAKALTDLLEEHAEGSDLNINSPLQLELSNEQTKETNMDNQERLAREWAQSVDVDTLNEEERAVRAHVLATTSPLTMADVEWDEEKHVLAGAVTKKGTEVIMLDLDDDLILARQIATRELINYDGYELTPNGKKYELREITVPEHPVEPSTKTMDEYSPEERADMIGMWAEYRRGGEPRDFMIIEGGVNQAGRVPCYNPDAPVPHAWAPDPDELIPRFDLPRVWSKDGEPCEPTVSSGENVDADQPEHPEVLYTLEDYENAPEGTIVAGSGYSPYVKGDSGSWSSLFDGDCPPNVLAGIHRAVLRWG